MTVLFPVYVNVFVCYDHISSYFVLYFSIAPPPNIYQGKAAFIDLKVEQISIGRKLDGFNNFIGLGTGVFPNLIGGKISILSSPPSSLSTLKPQEVPSI